MNQGNTAFILISAALVLLMTPGLAFFYGGLVKAKSVISMMMMSFGALSLISVLWVLYGYAVVFGGGGVTGLFGFDPSLFGLQALLDDVTHPEGSIPKLANAAFQCTFAIITVALISGAIADRAKFGSWLIFAGVWSTLVYFPVAYWVFNLDKGWLSAQLGALDFAGGTAVHINGGAAALALALVLGKRVGFQKGISKPHNVPLVLLGASLLWFGWFGFNAGSEAAADGVAALVFVNTMAAPAAAILAWLIVEKLKYGKPTSTGAASGAVAGLVAITPACNILSPFWSLVLGFIAGAATAVAGDVKFHLGFDDSLDVVSIHVVGGIIGTLFIGLVGTDVGGMVTGDWSQLAKQALSVVVVFGYSFLMSYAIAWIIEKTVGFRINNVDEIAGIDTVLHGEDGYVLDRV